MYQLIAFVLAGPAASFRGSREGATEELGVMRTKA